MIVPPGDIPRGIRCTRNERALQADLIAGHLLAMLARVHPETFRHSQRVAYLSLRLSLSIGSSAQELETLRIGAQLHDLGKLGIPLRLLEKAGPLNGTEFEIVKEHPVLGAQFLEGLGLGPEILSIVMHHHERWDGLGYPNELAGNEIPIMARIVALADVFDALTSHRSYRNTLSVDDALQVIVEGAGNQFDPCLVRDFIRLDFSQMPNRSVSGAVGRHGKASRWPRLFQLAAV